MQKAPVLMSCSESIKNCFQLKEVLMENARFTNEHDDYSLVMDYMQKTLPTFIPDSEDGPFYITRTVKDDNSIPDGYTLVGTGTIEARTQRGGRYEVEMCVVTHKTYRTVFIAQVHRI